MSDDSMSPEELESLYNGPSAGSGPEAGWQPPRVPPPPPEREPPTWVGSDQREDAEVERLNNRAERLVARTERLQRARRTHEERAARVQADADARAHQQRLEQVGRLEAASAQAHRERMEETARLEAVNERAARINARAATVNAQALEVYQVKGSFWLGFAAGAIGATACFLIREWWRADRRHP